jgi:type 1 fimbria pilin
LAQADTKLVGGDMYFHGTIRALACSLAPGGDKIEVDLSSSALVAINSVNLMASPY